MFSDKKLNEHSMDDICRFLNENDRFRYIVSEAISAYSIRHDDSIWELIEESIKTDK
jgi:hypothetical protein